MRNTLLYCLIFYTLPVHSQYCFFPDETETLFSQSMQLINPAHANWVKSTSAKLQDGQLEATAVQAETSRYAMLGNLGNSDIEALVFLVLMQATKSAQEDLKSIMAKVKAINNDKSKMRSSMNALKSGNSGIKYNGQLDSLKRASGLVKTNTPSRVNAQAMKPVTKKDIDTTIEKMKNDLDSMSEMGEMESLKLQMAMDQMSKMMSTLSNIMKKISGTAATITQNLK